MPTKSIGPPVVLNELANSPKLSMIGAMSTAQIKNIHGLNSPARANVFAGTPKIPAPIMPFIANNQSPTTDNWRFKDSDFIVAFTIWILIYHNRLDRYFHPHLLFVRLLCYDVAVVRLLFHFTKHCIKTLYPI